jgi:hypothetical protein
MKYLLIREEITYTGEQLKSNFAYTHFGVTGDSIVAFCGPCDVKKENMVDIEDRKAGHMIYSENMLHFIVEHHDTDLEKSVLRQIMLACIVKDILNDIVGTVAIRRAHTDLYDSDAKLSVSVATVSPVSALIHFGINISSANTPVRTKGLLDYEIDAFDFANRVMEKYVGDIDDAYHARCKVNWVR